MILAHATIAVCRRLAALISTARSRTDLQRCSDGVLKCHAPPSRLGPGRTPSGITIGADYENQYEHRLLNGPIVVEMGRPRRATEDGGFDYNSRHDAPKCTLGSEVPNLEGAHLLRPNVCQRSSTASARIPIQSMTQLALAAYDAQPPRGPV